MDNRIENSIIVLLVIKVLGVKYILTLINQLCSMKNLAFSFPRVDILPFEFEIVGKHPPKSTKSQPTRKKKRLYAAEFLFIASDEEAYYSAL